jgi:hypothetical protein
MVDEWCQVFDNQCSASIKKQLIAVSVLEPVNHEPQIKGHTVGRIANSAPSAATARQIFRNTNQSTMVKPAQAQLQPTQHGAPLLVAEGPKQHRQGITQKLLGQKSVKSQAS